MCLITQHEADAMHWNVVLIKMEGFAPYSLFS